MQEELCQWSKDSSSSPEVEAPKATPEGRGTPKEAAGHSQYPPLNASRSAGDLRMLLVLGLFTIECHNICK